RQRIGDLAEFVAAAFESAGQHAEFAEHTVDSRGVRVDTGNHAGDLVDQMHQLVTAPADDGIEFGAQPGEVGDTAAVKHQRYRQQQLLHRGAGRGLLDGQGVAVLEQGRAGFGLRFGDRDEDIAEWGRLAQFGGGPDREFDIFANLHIDDRLEILGFDIGDHADIG